MKKFFKSIDFYIALFCVLLVCFFIVPLIFFTTATTSLQIRDNLSVTNISYSIIDSALSNFLNFERPNDSLPHYIYKQKDEQINEFKNYSLGYENSFTGDTKFFGSIGLSNLSPKEPNTTLKYQHKQMVDSLQVLVKLYQDKKISNEEFKKREAFFESQKNKLNQKQKADKYYLCFKNYSLKDDALFFIKDNQNYLQYLVIDSTKENGKEKFGTYLYKKTDVLYLNSESKSSDAENKLCILISKEKYNVFSFIWWIYLIGFLSIFIVVFVYLPLKIIVNISRGKAFCIQNIKILKLIAFSFLCYAFLEIATPYIIHLILKNNIPNEFELKSFFNNDFIIVIYRILVFILFYVLAKAFKKGSNLQTQSDLTI